MHLEAFDAATVAEAAHTITNAAILTASMQRVVVDHLVLLIKNCRNKHQVAQMTQASRMAARLTLVPKASLSTSYPSLSLLQCLHGAQLALPLAPPPPSSSSLPVLKSLAQFSCPMHRAVPSADELGLIRLLKQVSPVKVATTTLLTARLITVLPAASVPSICVSTR